MELSHLHITDRETLIHKNEKSKKKKLLMHLHKQLFILFSTAGGARCFFTEGADSMAKEFAKGFYNSAAWKRCRLGYIQLRFGICEHCGKAIGTHGIVHHKMPLTPQNINNPAITLNWDNFKYLCTECHNAVDVAGAVREDVMFDADGDLISRPEQAKPPPYFKIGADLAQTGGPSFKKHTGRARGGGWYTGG